ncbi:hypothetical protein [Clostridium algidicarnis]|uniref:hypothetical protein n=1 Tax=Clostridium algidicarnis TaxID=37659 RepID=UPI003FD8ED35
MDSREIFSKERVKEKDIIKAVKTVLDINKEDILFVLDSDDWLKRNNRPIVVEFKGILDEDDEYPGYYYYDLFFADDSILKKLKEFNKVLGDNVIVTIN